ICLGVEASDVRGNRTVEQLDVLRQVADVPTESRAVPVIDRCAIEAYPSSGGRPHTDERTRQRRFARCAGPADRKALPGFELAGSAVDDGLHLPGSNDVDAFTRELELGGR